MSLAIIVKASGRRHWNPEHWVDRAKKTQGERLLPERQTGRVIPTGAKLPRGTRRLFFKAAGSPVKLGPAGFEPATRRL